MTDYDDWQREKPSWSDIDKARNRSHHVERERSGRGGPKAKDRAERERKAALAEAEKLFAGKKATPEHAKAQAALHGHYGTPKFLATARKYLKDYGLPDDWGSLILMLDMPQAEVVGRALEKLGPLYPQAGVTKQIGLKAKVETLALVAKDPDIQQVAQEFIQGFLSQAG
jgi:hypothetical protein